MKIHHVGYAVADIDHAVAEFESLGYRVRGSKTFDDKRHVIIQFVELKGSLVELIAPAREISPVSEIIKKRGNGPYHLCYETEDIESEVKKMASRGCKVIEPPAVALACANRKVAFLFKPSLGVFELIEKERA